MLALYIANKNYSSWSLRPWVLMKTLGIPFEERVEPFVEGGSWTAYRSFSPTGRVPVLHDGDTLVWDSLAIAEYLAETHPAVWPTDRVARAFARSAAAEMHSGFATLRNLCPMSVGVRVERNPPPPALEADFRRIDELWSEGLTRFGGPFLAGEAFTAVDAFFCPVAFRVQTYGIPLGDEAQVYADQLLALPAMADWYEAGLKEPWREVAHEAEIAATGRVVADYRAK